jgi:iron complex outermembrane receptor protein
MMIVKKSSLLPLLIAFVVTALGQDVTTNQAGILLPPVTVTAQSENNVVGVDQGVVEGTDFRNPGGFGPVDSKAATRTYTPNMENPVSVQVLPKEVLGSQQTIYLNDAIQNVAGVIPSMSSISGDSFSIRGFDMHNLTFEDGLRSDSYTVGYPRSMQNVENIEVVKGPSSVLYGQAEPGGLVNIDTKKPLFSNYFAVDQQIGSFSFYRTTVDASGPVDQGKTFLYRFNLDQQNNYSYRDWIHGQRLFLFPTFQWKPTDRTQINLELTYANVQQQYDNGVPFLTNGSPAPVGRGANYAMPWANQNPDQDFAVKLSLTHKFNDDWMLHAAFRNDNQNNPTPNGQYYVGAVAQDGSLPIYGGGTPFNQQWSQEYLADLTGKFQTTRFLKHTVLLGVDYYQQTFHYNYTQTDVYPTFTQNIYSPNFSTPVPPYDASLNGSTYQHAYDSAMFAQDQVELPGHIFGLAGFRYDSLSVGNTAYGTNGASACNQAVTPRFGLLWRPVKPLSIYGSYTANFGASAIGAITTNGQVLPPQSAQQWEFGLKQESDNKKFTATESIYQLTKQNVPQADPSNSQFSEAIGQITSKGVEVQLAGEIVDGWKLIAAYSYINAAITEGSSSGSGYGLGSQVGQRPTGIPYNSGSVWSTYEVQQGALKHLRFGAGVVYRSQEVTYVPNSNYTGYDVEQIPAFAVVNLMAAYPFEVGKTKWTAQVNLDNLFNTSYYSSINPYQAMPGAPVNFMASLKAEF